MKTLRYLPVALAVFISLAGCTFQDTGSEKISTEKEVREDGLPSLACFQCHAYDDFTDGFPHKLHIDMLGIHCTQCHAMRAHKEISLNDKLCGSCHNVGVLKMKSTAMPVSFNHKLHSSFLNCGKCHNKDTFPSNKDAKMTMEAMYQGGYCGKCHDGKSAFASTECRRCHRNM